MYDSAVTEHEWKGKWVIKLGKNGGKGNDKWRKICVVGVYVRMCLYAMLTHNSKWSSASFSKISGRGSYFLKRIWRFQEINRHSKFINYYYFRYTLEKLVITITIYNEIYFLKRIWRIQERENGRNKFIIIFFFIMHWKDLW